MKAFLQAYTEKRSTADVVAELQATDRESEAIEDYDEIYGDGNGSSPVLLRSGA